MDDDSESTIETDCVRDMINRAAEYGLLIEVVMSFGHERASGQPVEEACAAALWDWDL